jgi:hypothetical protein
MKTHVLMPLLLTACFAQAQKVTIKRVELAGEKIVVHYDLEDSNPNNEYQIALYSSQSNFATALTKVKGDVGNEVKPGSDHKIEWSVREELGPYKGRISLEVRGKQFVQVAKFTNITSATKMKRGKSHTITWKAGNSNPVNIELLNGGQRILSELNQPNNGSYTLYIPKAADKGKEYVVRITDTKNFQDVSTSQPFAVTRKIPLLLWALPAAAVVGVVVALAGGGGGGESPSDDPDGDIELPDLPGN